MIGVANTATHNWRTHTISSSLPLAKDFIAALDEALSLLAPELAQLNRLPNGYLVVQSVEDNNFELVWQVGEGVSENAPAAKYIGWKGNAKNKVERVIARPNDISAWQSRLFEGKLYGGGIRAGAFVIGFSGLPEKMDEAICAYIAHKLDLVTLDYVRQVFAISDNEIGRELMWLAA